MNELLMMIDAWFDTEQGVFWGTVAAFVALAMIPLSVLIWGAATFVRDFRENRRMNFREQVARELQSHDTPVNF